MSNINKFWICQEDTKYIDNYKIWCDYMRVNFKWFHKKFRQILNLIDTDNSNFYVEEYWMLKLSYIKLNLSMGVCLQISLVYNDTARPICLYNEFSQVTVKLSWKEWRLDFYGSLYRLIDIWYVPQDYIEKVIEWVTNQKSISLSRYDVAIDVFFNTKMKIKPYSEFKANTEFNIWTRYTPYYKWKNLESWSFGTKDTNLYLIRVYDKIADTKVKWKFSLYSDYLKYPSVHRHEIQFMSRYLKYISRKDAYSQIALTYEKSFFQYVNWNWKNFKFQKYTYTSDAIWLDNQHITRYVKDVCWRLVTLANAGINPYTMVYNALIKGTKKNQEFLLDFLKEPYVYALARESQAVKA